METFYLLYGILNKETFHLWYTTECSLRFWLTDINGNELDKVEKISKLDNQMAHVAFMSHLAHMPF
jgi:hypothetical protein